MPAENSHATNGPVIPSREEVLAEHVLPDMITGLGHTAVAGQIAKASFDARHETVSADFYNENIDENLQEARDILTGLSEKDRKVANNLLAWYQRSPWLDQELGLEDRDVDQKDYVGVLTAKNDDGTYKVGNETFMNFLEQRNFVAANVQRASEHSIEPLKEKFEIQMLNAAAKGWIPRSVLNNLSRLDNTQVLIDDGFMTTIKGSLAATQHPYAKNEPYIVRLAPGRGNDPGVVEHEFVHVLEGEKRKDEAKLGELERPIESIGLERLFGEGIGGRAVTEAVTEQLADALIHGKVEVTDPGAKVRKEASYYENRQLLHILSRSGRNKIPMKTFFAAMFENSDTAEALGDDSAMKELERQLKASFPFANVVREISNLTAEEGQDPDKAIAKYAFNLDKRSFRHKLLPNKLANVATAHLRPRYKGKHRAEE